jgi:hypothetical protein
MKSIGYWATTLLLAIAFAASGTANLTRSASATSGMAHLGYPLYLTTILGVWQLLGAVAVLLPGYPALKEWAYAGMVFDLTGAAASHFMVGDRAGRVLAPVALLALAVASWAQRPDSRLLFLAHPALQPEASSARCSGASPPSAPSDSPSAAETNDGAASCIAIDATLTTGTSAGASGR